MWDQLWINLNLATMDPSGAAGGDRGTVAGGGSTDQYGLIEQGAVAIQGDRIAWAGPVTGLPGPAESLALRVRDAGGLWATPGLIDCHTHIVFAGNRAREFGMRLRGASYEEVARAGGGIVSTVRDTRAADLETLAAGAIARARRLARDGVTTLEIKSGYGLDTETELRMLKAARRVAEATGLAVVPSFLGAHAVPPEFQGNPDGYIDLVVEEMLPAVADAGLCAAVDAFGERIAFTPTQVERVFRAAADHGLPVKLHADQLSDQGGAALAARFGALSADHLEYTGADGARAMGEAGTTAVLLPGAFYTLKETTLPPIDSFREFGVTMAVATDCNPGSSPLSSLVLAMNMACTLFCLTPDEALAGTTRHAAAALGLGDDRGRIRTGYRADLAFWDISHPDELAYRIGDLPCCGRMLGGVVTWWE